MKKITLFFYLIFITFFLFSAEKRYVNCKQLDLRATNTNFGKKTGTVSYGEELTVLSENNNWLELQSEKGVKGWAQETNLSKRKISSSSFSVKKDEIALAGKGFGEELEAAYKKKAINANYYQMNATEKLKVADVELKKFLVDGKLNYIAEENAASWKTTVANLFSDVKSLIPAFNKEVFTSEQKYYIGRAVSANILAKYKIYNSSKAQKYLSEICQSLVLNSDEPELFNGWTVFILDSGEINAFATSAGHILVTRGLLKCADSEDALAAVIAHEVSHILLGHSIKAIETNKKIAGFSEKWNALMDSADALLGEKVGDSLEDFTGIVDDMASSVFEKGYSQAQEFEADSKALQILAVAGYNPQAMVTMLEKIKQNEAKSKGMKNHPSAEKRISNVQLRLKTIKYTGSGEQLRNKRFASYAASF